MYVARKRFRSDTWHSERNGLYRHAMFGSDDLDGRRLGETRRRLRVEVRGVVSFDLCESSRPSK